MKNYHSILFSFVFPCLMQYFKFGCGCYKLRFLKWVGFKTKSWIIKYQNFAWMFLIKVLFHRGFFGPFLLLGFVKIPLDCLPINKVIAASAIFGIIIVTIRIQVIFLVRSIHNFFIWTKMWQLIVIQGVPYLSKLVKLNSSGS